MKNSHKGSVLQHLIRRINRVLSTNSHPEKLAPDHTASFNARAYRFFSILRYLTLLLTSLFFLLGPSPLPPLQKYFLVVLLFGLAVIFVRAYPSYQKNIHALTLLASWETLAIAGLVIYTGGHSSPFIWYILNPLVLSSMHLPYFYTWGFLSLFLAGSILGETYLGDARLSIGLAVQAYFDLLLLLPLFTLITQIFTRIYSTLAEQSHQLEVQQEELVRSYIDLSKNHQLMQTLSDFQRNIVACKNEHDIYSQLVAASHFALPLHRAVVLVLDDPLYPERTQSFASYELISDGKSGQSYLETKLVNEIKDRWQELFSNRSFLAGEQQNWLVAPVRLEKQKTIAVFLAQVKDLNSLNQVKENLLFFIQFAEQVIQGLQNFRQTEEILQHLSNIYQAVETISRRGETKEILDLFCNYARSLTGSEKIIFWVDSDGIDPLDSDGSHSIYSVKGKISVFPEEFWQGPLLRAWAEIKDNPSPLVQMIEDDQGRIIGQMTCVPVKSWARCFGIMASLQTNKNYNVDETLQKLTFLAKMAAVAIERNITEVFTDKLLLLEEQKRIANEIHDNISQNLFSIVYGLESISRHADIFNPKLKKQISSIQEVASRTAKELRVLIYRLSPRKRGDETFVKEIRDYLTGLSNINDVSIDFQAEGSEEYLNPAMRSAFYRIIKEATGNAIRHGQCKKIKVDLEMTAYAANLEIMDNGMGFDVQSYFENERFNEGLGVMNMQALTHSLQGRFEITSVPGEKTRVFCHVPTSPVSPGKVLSN